MSKTAKKGRARPKKVRLQAALIRAFWAAVFPAIGFAVEYLADIDRLREFGFAIPIAIAVGASLYGVKKYFFDSTTW